MHIPSDHVVRQYTAVSFGLSTEVDRQREMGRVLRRSVEVVEVPPAGLSPEDSDVGTEPLHIFLEGVEPLRQELSAKRLRGEPLGLKEQLVLEVLNSMLDALLIPPAPESPEVTQALLEARRLLEKYADG